MMLYLHIFNADPEEWDTRNIGIVSESAEPMDEADVRMRVFGSGPYKDTPRTAYGKELLYHIVAITPGLEIWGSGYDRCSLETTASD